jgi:DNA-binding transcriptional LysR family regulator
MNSSDLRFFEAVARLGSMNKAARGHCHGNGAI